jgi:hypothetical protein
MSEEVKKVKRKIFGLLVATMFLVIAIPQIGAVDHNEKVSMNEHVFGLCYIENIDFGDFDPAPKCPYFGGITILGGGKEAQTTIYKTKGGEELAHFEGPQIVVVLLMAGYHEYTENSVTFAGHSFGVIVI